MSSEFGFNKQALEAIKKILRGKSQAQRLGILCFDELSIKITFNISTFRFEGFVNIGSSIDEATRKLANHGLVFMFRQLLDSWERRQLHYFFIIIFNIFLHFFHIYSFLLQLIVQTSLNNKE